MSLHVPVMDTGWDPRRDKQVIQDFETAVRKIEDNVKKLENQNTQLRNELTKS